MTGQSAAVELLIIFGLVLANGFFAAAEIAIIAARRGRLEGLASQGDRGARRALDLANNPDRFLPTVQVGITLVGTFAAVFGGAHLVTFLDERLAKAPVPLIAESSNEIALVAVVLGITVLSVIFGELVPKRLALQHATQLSRWVSLPITIVAQVARPAIAFLRFATEIILKLLKADKTQAPTVSVEDIRHLIEMGSAAGVLDQVEKGVALEALQLGERTVRSIMRPRIDIDAVDVTTPPKELLGAVAMAGFTRLPVYEGDLDHIIGYVHLKDVVRQQYLGWPLDIRRLLRPPMFVPESLSVDRLLILFEEQNNRQAIILDEFGGTAGLVTLEDVLRELVGDIGASKTRDADQEFIRRDDHSWLVDGKASVDDLLVKLALRPTDDPAARSYSTVAGLVLHQLGRIPKVGEVADWRGARIEVVDMDGPRIDRLLVTAHSAEAHEAKDQATTS